MKILGHGLDSYGFVFSMRTGLDMCASLRVGSGLRLDTIRYYTTKLLLQRTVTITSIVETTLWMFWRGDEGACIFKHFCKGK